MNSVKIIQLSFLVLLSGLNFSVAAMLQEEEKPAEKLWKQDLANLSNNENWDDKGFPTQKWLESAVKHAIEGEKPVTNLIYELNDKLRELYEVTNPRTGKKMIASTFNEFFNAIDNSAIINIFEKALTAKITSEPKSELINEQKQQQQQKLEEQKQKEEKQRKDEMVWKQNLANLANAEKFYSSAWKEDLANLSNSKNWDDKGFLTQKWIESAIEDAIELIEEGRKTIEAIMDQLDDRLCELYNVKNSRTGKKMIASTFSKFYNAIDNSEITNIFEKALTAKITPEPKSTLSNEQKQQQQQKLEEQKQKEEEQLKNKKVWEQYLADLSKGTNWYNDTFIKQKLMRHERNNEENYNSVMNELENLESKVPTREWMENAAAFATKLINEGKVTKESITSALHKVLTNYYGRGSYKVSVFTVGFVIDEFSKLLDEKQLYKNRQQQQKEKEQQQERVKELQQKTEQMQEQRKQEQQEEISKYEIQKKVEQELEKADKYLKQKSKHQRQQKEYTLEREQKEHKLAKTLQSLLDTVSKGWKKAPSEDWQENIIKAAIALIENNNTPEKRNEMYDAINNAIGGYSKTLWFPDRQAIAAAKNNIFKQIYSSTVPEFKQFAQYFKVVAESQVSENNDPDKDVWIYDTAESYYNLNSKTLEKIAHDAAVLIKYRMVPTSVIENMMRRELVEARRGKHPQFRSPDQLGIMKAISGQL